MTIAFAKNDPDGNGIDDTLGYNVNSINALGKWVILGIAPECNVYSWTENNGFYVPSWSTDAFKQVVKDYRLLYEERVGWILIFTPNLPPLLWTTSQQDGSVPWNINPPLLHLWN